MASDKRNVKPETLELLRTTIIELFSEGQFHQVGVRAICEKAGVSPQTVYKYFGEKDRLLLACIETDMHKLLCSCVCAAQAHDSAVPAMIAVSDAFFDFYSRNPLLARIVYLNIPSVYWANRSSKSRDALADLSKELLRKGMQHKEIKTLLDVDVAADALSGTANRIVTRWAANECKGNLRKRGRQGIEILLNGLADNQE